MLVSGETCGYRKTVVHFRRYGTAQQKSSIVRAKSNPCQAMRTPFFAVGWVIWLTPFLLARRHHERARVIDRRARWGVLLVAVSYSMLWQNSFNALAEQFLGTTTARLALCPIRLFLAERDCIVGKSHSGGYGVSTRSLDRTDRSGHQPKASYGNICITQDGKTL